MIKEIEYVGDRASVALQGKIYSGDVDYIQRRLNEYLDKGCRELTVELAGVNYLNSDCLGALVQIHRRAAAQGGGVTITGVQGIVAELFAMTRLTKIFRIQ